MELLPSTATPGSASWQQGFALLCWSLQAGPADAAEFERLTAPVTDWEPFISQLRWHRVSALAWQRLAPFSSRLPDTVNTALQELRQQIGMRAMKHSMQLLALARLFSVHDIPFIVLKGITLSLQLHGDPARRFSKDIDILVREQDTDACHQLLLRNGYHRAYPGEQVPPNVLNYYRQFKKDCTYVNEEDGTQLELHWRFDNNPHFLPLGKLDPFHHCAHVNLAGVALPVLSPEHNALYLIMHAAHSCWARLSWLTDIARLLQQPLPDVPCHGDWRARWLLRSILQTLQAGRYPGNTLRLLHPLLYSNGLRYWLFHLRRNMALSLNDIALLPLPRALFFLYYPLRPLLWSWRRSIGPQ